MPRQIPDHVVDYIKAETGAQSLILIICDSKLPCPDALAGEVCLHGHDITTVTSGMDIEHAIDVLEKTSRAYPSEQS